MTVDEVTTVVRDSHVQHHRLMVTEKDAEGCYRPVGVLGTPAAGQYTFHYLRSAVERPGFRPFLGFFSTSRSYRSDGLFPLFAERIMDPRRPEHPMYLAALDLSGEVTPLEVLGRSGGQRAGDGIMLLPIPEVAADGSTHATFLVHGMRYVTGADERAGRLLAGDALFLRPEPDNQTNARAVLVVEGDDQPLGYVPDVLLDVVHSLDDVRLSVVRVNGPEVGTRLRLLVRLDGQADPDAQPCTGPAWETVD